MSRLFIHLLFVGPSKQSITALLVAAMVLPGNPAPALFGIGAVTVLLLFIGIHNAWDSVTYVAIEFSQPQNKSQD